MIRDESCPGYEELFGELDFRGDDDARSVYSPAAYFVDLLALLEGTFDRPSLLERRPDLTQVILDKTNTFTETPYLDIVNQVLERLIGANPYDILRNRRHPFGLPFSLRDEKVNKYLRYLQVTPLELYQLFAARPDHDVVAREYLQLSPDDVAVVTTSTKDETELAGLYGLATPETLGDLQSAERFAEATGLSGAQVVELIMFSAPVTLSADGKRLEWGGSVPTEWLDRIHRLIRLARMTGLSLTDLGLALNTCCAGQIDPAALRTLAIVLRLHRDHDLTVTEICQLVVPIEKPEVQGCSGDIIAARNNDYRFRLANWIEVAESDIVTIVRRYREHYAAGEPSPFDQGDIGLPAIGLLHRAGHLAGTLGIGVDELFDVLVALDSDPSLRRYTTFGVLDGVAEQRPDSFTILAGGAPADSLWLAQTLFAVVGWMQAAGFAGRELTDVLGGRPDTDDETLTTLLDGIRTAFEQVAFDAGLFAGDRFGPRAAKVVHDVLTAYDNGVVSAADDRLLRLDPDTAATAAYDGVTDLGVIAAEDFLGLGLGERLQNKIFANLIHLGHLHADGTLAVDSTESMALTSDFGAYRESLFKMIGTVVNGTAAFFPSDLAALDDLPPERQAELYDNLGYNGYLDDSGDLTDPEFFLDPANEAAFEINADLQDATGPVTALLGERITGFTDDPLALDPTIFAELRFTETELTALTASLTFNGYLDGQGNYRDKATLIALPLKEFGLALAFYPRRRAILDAIQAQILEFRTELHTFSVADFADLADDVMSRRVVTGLDGAYTADGRVLDEELFADPSGSLDLGPAFTTVEQGAVFSQITVVLEGEKPYRLAPAALTDLGFTAEERDRLQADLIDAGFLIEGFAVAEEWLPYFRNVNNAHTFTLPGLADFSTDVFFLLHTVAGELAGAVNEVVDALITRAGQQKQALDGALADAFGLPSATAAAIAEAVTGGPEPALDTLVAPVLDAEKPPTDPHFRLAYRRIRRFALLAAKLGLDPTEVTAVFTDQDLVGKFPENLTLPPGVLRFDALLAGHDGKIYLFAGTGYWTYSADTFALKAPNPTPLTGLSPRFADLTGIDAAFTLPSGLEWLVGHTADGTSRAFTRLPGGTRWAPQEQVWGKLKNNFTDPVRIDGAFVDTDGRTYLFAGDQYLRYSTADYTVVDEGYPRPVAEWREREGLEPSLAGSLDAFQAPDGTIHVLTGATGWGRVRNNFENAERLDAAYSGGSAVHLFSGGQVVRYSDSIENPGVCVDEGYPRTIHDVPAQFAGDVEAAFTDPNGVLHLFKDGQTASAGGDIVPTAQRWGVLSPALPSGTVDAALAGLDGKTYLFSGGTYLRYSTADYSVVDPGYPQAIDPDWGGLSTVDAAFVMDGSTYLFGTGGLLFDLADELRDDLAAGRLTPELRNRFAQNGLALTAVTLDGPQWTLGTEQGISLTVRIEGLRTKVYGDGSRYYVRYSTNDYRTPDAGFPKPLSDNWWNMPDGLNLGPVDAVFTGGDNHTYLFAGNRFVRFDARHRWWSEPLSLRERWDSVPFDKVDAAFVGTDGRTYLFSGPRYVRYSTTDYTEIDDGYPANIAGHWDHVRNNIERTGRVDAALVTEVTEQVDGVDVPRTYTYLFSGDQFVRYLGTDYAHVQPGYPRLLASLSAEPGLAALDTMLDSVDAAFADRRTTYLFSDGECHVVSAGTYRRYDDLNLGTVSCAFIENGSVITAEGPYYQNGWCKRSALEGRGGSTATPFRPRTLRTVPEQFRTGLNSVLMGADGNTYLFQGATCFNTQLNHAYPLAEEWGRPRNAIYEHNRVDAAFVGRDGKTYLFSDDQFVVYPDAGTMTDGDPRPIAEHWAGLTGVALAYVQGGKTFVFEHPDIEGMLRYLVYSGTDYSTPDEGYPAVVDDGILGAPNGFPFPDAVIVEGDTLILLSGQDCVSYNAKTKAWSMVRPIERLFPGFGQGVDAPDGLHTAFTAVDGTTYFFFGETYARFAVGAFGPLSPTRDRWGLSRNPFITGGGTIDAAFVWGQYTFLFSGDHYVRYTGPGYRAIDPGYPKKTAGNLRLEVPFANLPESFDDAAGAPIDAVIGNERTIHLIIGEVCHTVSPAISGTYSPAGIGRMRNTIAESSRVAAALVADRRVYLLSDDQYARYSTADLGYVDDGYPRPLEALATELGMPALPTEFADGVDAAFRSPDGRTYLFRGRQFVRGSAPEPVSGTWGRVRNEFTAGGLDAAFVAPTGELYAFRKDQYVRYPAGSPLEYADQGFPRTVKDDWGDIPPEFEAGPDGAFSFEGRTYLTSGERYVRYSGAYHRVDRTFPQEFRHRWSGTSDYRLSDLHLITRFVDLARTHPAGLAELFVTGAEDPYQLLADLFGWDVDELRWARRNGGLLIEDTPEEKIFEIEFVLKLVEVFDTARKFGAGPSEIHDQVWSKRYGTPDPEATATALYGMLEHRTAPAEWTTLDAQLHNELNVLRRDALVAAVTPQHGTSRDLFERYLIDVDMGSVGTTSPVREAIAATPLFLHRYLIDLETVSLPAGTDPHAVKARIRTWWAWMRNYRIWEANRKVFLYPENYIRPELRTEKTPAFAALEDDLLQKEITAESVLAAYKRYLDEYTEVSRLAIAGGYVYTEDNAEAGARKLVLFGRTRTEPRRYYYREAEVHDGENFSATWQPWLKVDLQVAADRVDPVHAFGRVFVFWPVVEIVTEDSNRTTITTTQKDGGQTVTAPPPKYQVKIYYSFYNLNKEWVPAQLLNADPQPQPGPITGVGLYVQASRTVPGGSDHDVIVVQCGYLAGTTPVRVAYTLTPELYPLPAKETDIVPPSRSADPAQILDEPANTPIDPGKIVRFNAPADTTDGPWSSVDHKGGSFLCHSAAGPLEPAPLLPLKGNADNLPTTWDRIDAAVQLDNRDRYFFDSTGGKYLSVPADKPAAGRVKQTTADRFGVIGTNLVRTGVVDAVLSRGDKVFLFSGDEYYSYPKAGFGTLDAGYPKKLPSNQDKLPQWSTVDGAFTDPSGTEYFYSRERDGYVVSGALGTVRPVGDLWQLPEKTTVDAILTRGSRVYILFGDKYIRLGPDLRPEKDYPRQLAKNPDDLPEQGVPGPSFELGQGVITINNAQGTYTVRAHGVDEPPRPTRDLGRVPTAITRTGAVDAAYVADGKLFLVSGDEFVRYTLADGASIPDYIDVGYPKKPAQPVHAVFRRDDLRYVFSGTGYDALAPGQELDATLNLRPVLSNWRCLPTGFPSTLTGVLETDTGLYIFMGATYAGYPNTEAMARPYEISALPSQIVRLTSSTAYELNRRLLVGGIDALLAPDTQELDELPAFSPTVSDSTTIKVRPRTAKAGIPIGSHLDFDSANGIYNWEIFFHAPMLIARALTDAQRFEDAKRWYEYVFDPTERERYWRFLPFLAVDVDALVVGCRADLLALANTTVENRLTPILDAIEPMAPAFLPARELTGAESAYLAGLDLDPVRADLNAQPESEARRGLLERVELIGLLGRQYTLMGDRTSLMRAYRDDPFDPHRIAALRPAAYRRTVVMAYIDNLLDWGDLLFRQYTGESIDEARMLYIFAYDLLGPRPYEPGPRALPPAATYDQLDGEAGSTAVARLTADGALLEGTGAVHAGVANPYFYVPDNNTFLEYWTRVEDRLTKIRASLDIMGISRPVPLFEPPADVMALVEGVAKGASLDAITAALAAPVPAYKFNFLFRRAQELADRLRQLGGDLLNAFERRDVEALTLLQNRQEAAIQAMTRGIKENQVQIAQEGLSEMQAALSGAQGRVTHYQQLIADGLLPMQQAQIAMLATATAAQFVASGLKIGAAFAAAAPEVYAGPFIMGASEGGDQAGNALTNAADVSAMLSQGFSMIGEVLGIGAEQQRTEQDWNLQLLISRADVEQIGHQVTSAELQVAVAQRELEILDRETKNLAEVTAFLTGKFAGANLYGWMVERLSGLYFQTYHMAYELARSAEKAYQFERGATNGSFIQPTYWDSKRNGLLAADALALDLDRLGQAYVTGDRRTLEITKRVSLLQLDPMALLTLRNEGRCEFALTEELFDRDFPGHFRRQIRTVSVSFGTQGGPVGVNATLTQIDNKTVLSADPQAVKFLLAPVGSPPDSLRGDWRPSQQIALSDLEDGRDNNGLFELRYDDDRYLPFEGTGAVSRWRLDAGRPRADLLDVTIIVKYTAEQGGDTFGTAVRGMLRPYPSARYFDVANEFQQEWTEFIEGDSARLTLPITPDHLPGIVGRQITGVYARYELAGGGEARFLLNGDKRLALDDGKLLRTPGLSTGGWTLLFEGDKAILTDLGLILTYRAGAR
ncbi:MAG TPA: hemopexin repeat-containing protein [Pseudonocardiaceae bacterium]